MKLTEYEVSFTGDDAEVVRIDIDRWGIFSATLPLRISNQLQISKTVSEKSLGELRDRIDRYRDQYLEYLEPDHKVLIYSLTNLGTGDDSNRHYTNNASFGFRWAYAVKKCNDFYLYETDFANKSRQKMGSDRFRFTHLEYTPENLDKLKNIQAGIIKIHTMVRDLADNGFNIDFDKLLITNPEGIV